MDKRQLQAAFADPYSPGQAFFYNVPGRRGGIAAAGQADLWPETTAIRPLPGAATAMELLSTDINDNSAGNGARSVVVELLDASGNRVVETVATAGTTPVPIATPALRILDAWVAVNGAGLGGPPNLGTISIRTSGGGTTYAVISPGFSRAFLGGYSIPTGYQAAIVGGEFSVTADSPSEFQFGIWTNRGPTGATLSVWNPIGLYSLISGQAVSLTDLQPFAISAGLDLRITVERVAGAGTGQATGSLNLYMVPRG